MTEIDYLSPRTRASKEVTDWYSQRLQQGTRLVRWGSYGIPVLLFPTAGGDAEEVERFFLIKALESLLDAGRIKVYSVHSLAGRAWLTGNDVAHCVWTQKQFDEYIRHEVVPAIYQDCRAEQIPIITAGASIGAFTALLNICRHPEVFHRAICMSGTYDLDKWLQGQWFDEYHHLQPLHFVPGLPEDSGQLRMLRERFVLLVTGSGENEDVGETWNVANVLGAKGIPNRVDVWGPEWIHDWVTWREMLPRYLDEVVSGLES